MLLNLLWKYLLAYMQPAHTVLAFFFIETVVHNESNRHAYRAAVSRVPIPHRSHPSSTVLNKPSRPEACDTTCQSARSICIQTPPEPGGQHDLSLT